MAFPQWSLLGMGGVAILALLLLGMALYGSRPRALAQSGYDGNGLPANIRSLIAYAFAAILIGFGFFLAGVPLESDAETAVVVATPTLETAPSEAVVPTRTQPIIPTPTLGESASGAFGAPVVRPETGTPTFEPGATVELLESESAPPTQTPTGLAADAGSLVPTATPTPTATSTPSPTPTATSTSTASPTPTQSPTPTMTPTPILGQTAIIDTGGSTLWVRRTPGGSPIQLINHGDVVIVLNRRANQAGVLWQEIQTVDGTKGWVRQEYLELQE